MRQLGPWAHSTPFTFYPSVATAESPGEFTFVWESGNEGVSATSQSKSIISSRPTPAVVIKTENTDNKKKRYFKHINCPGDTCKQCNKDLHKNTSKIHTTVSTSNNTSSIMPPPLVPVGSRAVPLPKPTSSVPLVMMPPATSKPLVLNSKLSHHSAEVKLVSESSTSATSGGFSFAPVTSDPILAPSSPKGAINFKAQSQLEETKTYVKAATVTHLSLREAAEMFNRTPYFMASFGSFGQKIHMAANLCAYVHDEDKRWPNPRKQGKHSVLFW